MKKISRLIPPASVTACMAVILLKPETYLHSAAEGLKLWALVVVPSLLPFFFFTALLSETGVTKRIAKLFEKPCRLIFGTSGISAYVFVMSILSGYPVGAKIIGDLGENKLVSEVEATKMSTFCSTSGPIFIIGSVGVGMFGSARIGKIIFSAHVLSAIVTGVIFSFYKSRSGKTESVAAGVIGKRSENANVLYDCAYSSVISLAVVGGFICVFYVVADICQNLDVLFPLRYLLSVITKNDDLSSAFCYGLIECTRGCKMLSTCRLSTYSPAFASALVSFGGVSVLVQSISFLKKAKAKTSVFLLAKLLQTTLSFCLCLLFIRFIV